MTALVPTSQNSLSASQHSQAKTPLRGKTMIPPSPREGQGVGPLTFDLIVFYAPKGQKITDGGANPRFMVVETIALKGRQIVLPPLRGFVEDGLSHPGV